jgi:hypothetical protein
VLAKYHQVRGGAGGGGAGGGGAARGCAASSRCNAAAGPARLLLQLGRGGIAAALRVAAPFAARRAMPPPMRAAPRARPAQPLQRSAADTLALAA